MATKNPNFSQDDFEGFGLDALARFAVRQDPPPLQRSAKNGSFAEAQRRAIRGLALAKRDLAGQDRASFAATAETANAARVSREASRVAEKTAAAGDRANLPPPKKLPDADAGVNLAARILPTPRP